MPEPSIVTFYGSVPATAVSLAQSGTSLQVFEGSEVELSWLTLNCDSVELTDPAGKTTTLDPKGSTSVTPATDGDLIYSLVARGTSSASVASKVLVSTHPKDQIVSAHAYVAPGQKVWPLLLIAEQVHDELVALQQKYIDFAADPVRVPKRFMASWVHAMITTKGPIVAEWVKQDVIDLGFSDDEIMKIKAALQFNQIPDKLGPDKPGGPLFEFVRSDNAQHDALAAQVEDHAKRLTAFIESAPFVTEAMSAGVVGLSQYGKLVQGLGQSKAGRDWLVQQWKNPTGLTKLFQNPDQWNQHVNLFGVSTGLVSGALGASFLSVLCEFGPAQSQFFLRDTRMELAGLDMEEIAKSLGVAVTSFPVRTETLDVAKTMEDGQLGKTIQLIDERADGFKGMEKFPIDHLIRFVAVMNFAGTLFALGHNRSDANFLSAARSGVGFISTFDKVPWGTYLPKKWADDWDVGLNQQHSIDDAEIGETLTTKGKLAGFKKLANLSNVGAYLGVLQGIGDLVAGVMQLDTDKAHDDKGAEVADYLQISDGILIGLGSALFLAAGGETATGFLAPVGAITAVFGMFVSFIASIVSALYPSRSEPANWMLHSFFGKDSQGTLAEQVDALKLVVYTATLSDVAVDSDDHLSFTLLPTLLHTGSTMAPVEVVVTAMDGSTLYQQSKATLNDWAPDVDVVGTSLKSCALTIKVDGLSGNTAGAVAVNMVIDVDGDKQTVVPCTAKGAWIKGG